MRKTIENSGVSTAAKENKLSVGAERKTKGGRTGLAQVARPRETNFGRKRCTVKEKVAPQVAWTNFELPSHRPLETYARSWSSVTTRGAPCGSQLAPSNL